MLAHIFHELTAIGGIVAGILFIIIVGWILNWLFIEFLSWQNPPKSPDEGMVGPAMLIFMIPYICILFIPIILIGWIVRKIRKVR